MHESCIVGSLAQPIFSSKIVSSTSSKLTPGQINQYRQVVIKIIESIITKIISKIVADLQVQKVLNVKKHAILASKHQRSKSNFPSSRKTQTKIHNGARTPKASIVYVMPRPSLRLYITFVNTFSSDKNIFSKDKKVIV